MYWLRKGRVVLLNPDACTAESMRRFGGSVDLSVAYVGVINEGDCFGQNSVLFNSRQAWDARAMTYCELLYLSRDSLEQLSALIPSLRGDLEFADATRGLGSTLPSSGRSDLSGRSDGPPPNRPPAVSQVSEPP